MTFTGSFAAVNTALSGLSFNPTTSFTGAASLQIVTADQGNTGSGGTLTDNDTIAITVVNSYFDVIWGETSLLNYYRLDDTTGTAIDDLETANNNGTYFGSPTRAQPGAIAGNSSVLFDGVDDYGSITRQISTNFTVEFWFKSTQGLGTGTSWWQGAGLVDAEVSGAANDFGVSLRSDGKVVAGVGTPDVSIVSSSGGYNNGVWHHVVFTRSSSGVFNLYVDGAAAGSATGSTAALTSNANINFGRLASANNYYQGNLDEIAIYNTALSAAAIAAHYSAR